MLINPYVWAADSLPAPLTGKDTIYLIGASRELGTIETANGTPDATFGAYMLAKHGLNLQVIRYAYSGATMDVFKTNWDSTIRPAIAGRSDGGAGAIIVAQPLGNTITELKPYANASPATLAAKQSILNGLNSDFQSVVGDASFLMNHSWRNYNPSGSCITNEELGSLPFMRNWVWTLLPTTRWIYKGLPYINLYPLERNNYTLTMIDEVHSDAIGYAMTGMYEMDCVAAAIKGVAPPQVPLKADPINDQKPKSATVLLDYRNNATIGRSSVLLGATSRGYTGASLSARVGLIAWDGYEPALGLAARSSPWTANSQTGVTSGNTSRTILNDALRLQYHSSTSTDFIVIDKITGGTPGQAVDWELLSCRLVSAGQTRLMELSYDGVNVLGEIDGGCLNGAVPRVFTGTTVFDANGEFSLWGRCKSGNTTGMYVNALFVKPK